MSINDLAKINRKMRNAFFGALVIIISFGMYNQITSPHVKWLFALHRYEAAVDDISSKNKDIKDTLKVSKKNLEELTAQFAHVRNILFTPSEAEEFFSDLQAISVETECPIYSLTFVPDSPSEEVKQAEQALGVTAKKAVLSVAGLYENIMRLMERLQTRSRKVWVEGLSMEAVNDEIPQIKCDVTVKIYVMQNKEAARHE